MHDHRHSLSILLFLHPSFATTPLEEQPPRSSLCPEAKLRLQRWQAFSKLLVNSNSGTDWLSWQAVIKSLPAKLQLIVVLATIPRLLLHPRLSFHPSLTVESRNPNVSEGYLLLLPLPPPTPSFSFHHPLPATPLFPGGMEEEARYDSAEWKHCDQERGCWCCWGSVNEVCTHGIAKLSLLRVFSIFCDVPRDIFGTFFSALLLCLPPIRPR